MIVEGWVEFYKYRFLKKIDFSEMTIKNVSERILTYQRFIQKEFWVGVFFALVFLGVWRYLDYKQACCTENNFDVFSVLIPIFIVFIVTYIMYKRLYYNRIRRIKKTLKELEEFEQS